MITGDNPLTAIEIAKNCNILIDDKIIYIHLEVDSGINE